METTSQSLATESFSYSWLVNKTPPFDEYLKSSFRDTNFIFDNPISKSSFTLIHADEIFSNGHILPIYVDQSNIKENVSTSPSLLAVPISSLPSRNSAYQEHRDTCLYFLKNFRKSSKRVIIKCFAVLRPFCKKLVCPRKSTRVDDIVRKVWEVQSQGNSVQASPRKLNEKMDYRKLRKVKSWDSMPQEFVPNSPSNSINVCSDIESSIYEAVLHCKKSFEN